mgnify:CR=1 FL=1
MARIVGVEIPGDKRIEIALRYIYGIGPSNARSILARANIDPGLRATSLCEQQLSQIVHAIQEGKYVIAQANASLAEDGTLTDELVSAREHGESVLTAPGRIRATVSPVMRTGALRPGMAAVVIIISARATAAETICCSFTFSSGVSSRA